jgi:GntR family transcriptional regulator
MAPITLNYTNGIPIYVQIKEAYRNAVLTGAFAQGTQLPTVRQLAVQLKINANTVSRAYAELEREGVLSRHQGKGTFVTLSKDIDYDKLKTLEQKVVELLEEAHRLGFTRDDVLATIDSLTPRDAKE